MGLTLTLLDRCGIPMSEKLKDAPIWTALSTTKSRVNILNSILHHTIKRDLLATI